MKKYIQFCLFVLCLFAATNLHAQANKFAYKDKSRALSRQPIDRNKVYKERIRRQHKEAEDKRRNAERVEADKPKPAAKDR